MVSCFYADLPHCKNYEWNISDNKKLVNDWKIIESELISIGLLVHCENEWNTSDEKSLVSVEIKNQFSLKSHL